MTSCTCSFLSFILHHYISDCSASNGRMMSRKSFTCCCGLIKEVFWHFPEWPEENHKTAHSVELVSQLRFKLSTSQVHVWSIICQPAQCLSSTIILFFIYVFPIVHESCVSYLTLSRLLPFIWHRFCKRYNLTCFLLSDNSEHTLSNNRLCGINS